MIFCEDYRLPNEIRDKNPEIDGLPDPYSILIAAIAATIKPPPPVDYVEWARQNVVFDNDNQFPGPYNPDLFPFFKKPLRCLQPDHPCREVILRGSAQTGKTITAEVFLGATMDTDPGGFQYVTPTLEMAAIWIKTKWKGFVNSSPALRRIFPREKHSRDVSNSLLFKERADGRGFIRVAGANSPASLTMSTFRRQVHDDLSKWSNNEHGDPENQADKRSQAWGQWAKILKISTPGILGLCKITKNWERSNQQTYHVPCPHCGHRHALEWDNFKKSLHEGMVLSAAHFTCPACDQAILHHHKKGMLDATLAYDAWVSANPESKVEGFYIWCAYSPLVDWAYIADEYFKTLGDPEKEQNFMNDTVGVAYEQKGEAPPWKDLLERSRSSPYERGRIPADALIYTIGIDVQGDRVEWQLVGFGPLLRRWTIDHGVIEGHISETAVEAKLDQLLKRKWRNCCGRDHPADMIAIDANYETNHVKDWAKRHAETRVITIKGAREYTAPPMVLIKDERRNSGKIISRQKRHWMVGVSGMKGAYYKQLAKLDPFEKGYCGFPNDLEDDFFKQICSEKRILEVNKKTGFSEMRWVKLPNVRNEMLDTAIYAEAAARRLGWQTKSQEDWEILRADRETPPPEQQLDLLDPSKMILPPPPATLPASPKSIVSKLA